MQKREEVNLGQDSVIRLFFYFFIPSIFSMLSLSTHIMVDGFFVSHALGEDAVTALGLSWPIWPVLIALELLFSIGGSALIAYHLGKGEPQRAREIFSSIIYFVFIAGVIVSVLLFIWTREITLFLGASPEIVDLVVDYLWVTFLGAFVIFLHPILDMFAVNDKQPVLAMFSMITASVGNIVFNYIFLFKMDLGLQASALATILGNAIAISILLWHFLSKRGELFFVKSFNLGNVLTSAKNGIPAAISEMSSGVLMLLYNIKLMETMGKTGVLIYTTVMYGGMVFFMVLQSIAQGIQPISSFNFGAGKIDRVKQIYRFGIIFSLLMSVLIYLLFYGFGGEFARLLLDSKRKALSDPAVIVQIAFVMKIWFIAYFAFGINATTSIFLQSIQRPWGALLITLCYTVILTPIFLPLLSEYYGEIGIWSAYPLASVLTIFVAAGVLFYELKKGVFAK